ncbi:MAG: hypothetical protein KDK40_01650, partial [Chlamydiia bacterium]|nr:hypothetical protein [Chlamydiia bacterium]
MKAQSSFLQESLFLVETLREYISHSIIEDESVGYAFRLAKPERTLPSIQAKIPPPFQRTHTQSPPSVTQPLQIQEAVSATPPSTPTRKIQPANPPQHSPSQPAKKRPPPKPQTPFKPSPAPLVEANSSLTPQATSLQLREIPIKAIKKS